VLMHTYPEQNGTVGAEGAGGNYGKHLIELSLSFIIIILIIHLHNSNHQLVKHLIELSLSFIIIILIINSLSTNGNETEMSAVLY
jgi:hypothetical protein